MALDVFVYWKSEHPTKDELQMCLEDYVRGIATEVVWDEDRFFVTLPGQYSHPFQRVGPSTPSSRETWRELVTESDGSLRPRQFEVWFDTECLDVITRFDDEVTNNIARGFAVLCARGWNGTIE